MCKSIQIGVMTLLAALPLARAAPGQTVIRHVSTNVSELASQPPYNTWTNAARTIQDAIDAADASASDWVWVTNGVYSTGGRALAGQVLTNRVLIGKPITVRSVNGPSNTFIVGRWHVPVTTPYGDAAVRCVYVTNNAELTGFTLTNGSTRAVTDDAGRGGGALARSTDALVSNCIFACNRANHRGGGAHGGRHENCIFFGNESGVGGGACLGTYRQCYFTGNYASHGGGASAGYTYSEFVDCVFSNNWAANGSGGVHGWTGPVPFFSNCVFVGNYTTNSVGGWGTCGGAGGGVFYNCVFRSNTAVRNAGGAGGGAYYGGEICGNTALIDGGGASGGAYYGVKLYDNVAVRWGGGANVCALYDSDLQGNTASSGGGAYGGTLYNCRLLKNACPDASGHTYGGGAAGSAVLYNCLLAGNYARWGGGASAATLYNCTVAGNSANSAGGGMNQGSIYNTIVYNNIANAVPAGSNHYWAGPTFQLSHANRCCIAQIPPEWAADPNFQENTDANPMLIDFGSGYGTNHTAGNYRLTKVSPCFNNGRYYTHMDDPSVLATNVWLGRDIDGGPRIRHNAVDIGAYELRRSRGSVFSAD